LQVTADTQKRVTAFTCAELVWLRLDETAQAKPHPYFRRKVALLNKSATRVREAVGWHKQHKHKPKQGITRPPNCGRTDDVII
jgi:hypothetical protein